MKTFSIKILFFLLTAFLLFGCLTSEKQFDVKPTVVVSTTIPSIQIAATATTIPATSSPDPYFISANSPDNKYTIGLKLSEVPVKLIITDNNSKHETEIPLTYRHYNKIVGEGPMGFTWTTDNKILMFVLYREPFPQKMLEEFSVFVAVDVEKAKILTMNYSSTLRGIWYEDKSEMAVLEHGGLNDIYDFYFPGTNCYKSSFESDCENSFVSPNGNWELSQWEQDADVTLIGLSGNTWKFSYSKSTNDLSYLLSSVHCWTEDGKYVFFSPAHGYGTSKVYGLFRMDLTNGNVVSLIGNGYISDHYFYFSVSANAKKLIYITTDKRLIIKNLQDNTKKTIQISLNASEDILNFIWSPDETKVIFAKVKRNEEYDVISADYLMLDIETGKLITILKAEPNYLNVKEITNSEVLLGEKSFSLVDSTIIKPTKP